MLKNTQYAIYIELYFLLSSSFIEFTKGVFGRLLVIDPANAQAWYDQGLILAKLERHEDAVASFGKALAIKPDFFAAYYNKARSLDILGQSGNAITVYDQAIELDPMYTPALHYKGAALARMGLFEEAIKAFDRALETDVSFAEAWFDKGKALASLGMYREGVRSFDKALSIEKNYADVYFHKGLVLANLGRHEDAILAFNKNIDLDAGNPNLLKEVLQSYVLDFIYNHPKYRRLNFYGGTCLHVVYGLNRLSEDLDFDNGNGTDLSDLAADLTTLFRGSLSYEPAEIKSQQSENRILRLTVKLPILNELGLSTYHNESLHLKVEVSHHKQIAVLRNTPVFYLGRSFVPSHFSLETMMAGKMIACLERNFQRGREGAFIEGRDYYDLLWFMQNGVRPLKRSWRRMGRNPIPCRLLFRP